LKIFSSLPFQSYDFLNLAPATLKLIYCWPLTADEFVYGPWPLQIWREKACSYSKIVKNAMLFDETRVEGHKMQEFMI
jgi:hypothetical protein